MSLSLLLVGLVCLALVPVHVIGGGRDCLRPMLDATFDSIAKATLAVCWHAVTLYLLGSGALLVWASLAGPTPETTMLVRLVATSFLAIAGLFMTAAIRWPIPGAWYKLGQWIAFLPMGTVAMFAG